MYSMVADSEEALMALVKPYEDFPMLRMGKIWSIEKAPKVKHEGKLAMVITYFNNID